MQRHTRHNVGISIASNKGLTSLTAAAALCTGCMACKHLERTS
jgi:hypothetical protein